MILKLHSSVFREKTYLLGMTRELIFFRTSSAFPVRGSARSGVCPTPCGARRIRVVEYRFAESHVENCRRK